MVIEMESLYSAAFLLMMKSWHFLLCGIQCQSGAACQLGSELCQEGIKRGYLPEQVSISLSKMEIFMEVNMA